MSWLIPFEMKSAAFTIRILSNSLCRQKCPQRSSHNVQQHSTFLVQSLFFMLVSCYVFIRQIPLS